MELTIVARPLPEKKFMCKRDDTLCSVKKYIDENLNPKKQNILDPRKEILLWWYLFLRFCNNLI